MIVTKIFDSQDMMTLIREALEARGYKVKNLELQWKSSDWERKGYCQIETRLDV